MVPDKMVPDNLVPDNMVPDKMVPDNMVPENSVPTAILDKIVPRKVFDTFDALSEMSLFSVAIIFKVSNRNEIRSIRHMSIPHRENKGNLSCRYRMFRCSVRK